jgi:hypothetical protein
MQQKPQALSLTNLEDDEKDIDKDSLLSTAAFSRHLL